MSVHADHGTRPVPAGEGRRSVAIAGGGLVGTALGLALGRSGIPVVVVEAGAGGERAASAYDSRPIALSQGSRRILDALGVWSSVAGAVTPITRIHVSDRGHFGFARLRAEDHGVDALGYVIPAAELGRALSEALRAEDAVEILRPAVVEDVRVDAGQVARLVIAPIGKTGKTGKTGESGTSPLPSSVQADLVVLCDGGRSSLRERLGVPVSEKDYGQWAITTRVETRRPHEGVAYERFTADGPLALLPMQGHHCGLVWSMNADTGERIAALDEDGFLSALGEQFGTRLGGFVSAGPRSAFPLQRISATAVTGERFAIIGNAANHLHPVAGQGLNLGLRDAAALAEVVAAALGEGGDPGGPAVLARYAAWRDRDQRLVSRATDTLVRLFSNRLAPLVLGRDLGLLAFDLLPPVKRYFGNHAMGLAGRQSRLARGLPL
jgi:2-octaprenyl-6-methoxyphenol hydroxylase